MQEAPGYADYDPCSCRVPRHVGGPTALPFCACSGPSGVIAASAPSSGARSREAVEKAQQAAQRQLQKVKEKAKTTGDKLRQQQRMMQGELQEAPFNVQPKRKHLEHGTKPEHHITNPSLLERWLNIGARFMNPFPATWEQRSEWLGP